MIGPVALAVGIAAVVLAFATPNRGMGASAVLAGLAASASALGLVAHARARRGDRRSTSAIAAVWIGVGALAIVAISVLPALLMSTPASGAG
ncbi:hypothetical protein [Agromyces marinus]|uniref:hypothetical protein n=1 Tax=Agromyces marinus TaxID=1389020 RepID=UPI001F230CF3|nr:hypothetical protein [Agromyces marinus]